MILLLNCCGCILFFPPGNQILILGVTFSFLGAVFFLIKFFLPVKYAYLTCLFLFIFLIIGFLKLLDIINAILIISLFIGSIVLIK